METEGNYNDLIIKYIDKQTHSLLKKAWVIAKVIGDRCGDRLLQPVTNPESPMDKGFPSYQ